jgi:SAM-dependent methyltransferase
MSKSCPACLGDARRPAAIHKGMTLFECTRCRTVYMDPMPGPETLHALYDDPYEQATQSYFAKPEKKIRRARRRARMLDRHVKGGRRFLEIGSSGGFMTEAMRERGYECTGIEPDKASIEYARRHYPNNVFFNGFFPLADQKLTAFDAIYCSEVIEHVPGAEAFVAALAGHLAPGGIVNITTPEVTHWNRSADITRWKDFNPPSHCIYYSPDGLGQLLLRHGIAIIHRRFNWKAGLQVYAQKIG